MSKSPTPTAMLESLRQEADVSFQRLGPEARLFGLPTRLRLLKERKALAVGDPAGRKVAAQEKAQRAELPENRSDMTPAFNALNAWFAQLEGMQTRYLGPANPDDSVTGPAPEAIEIRGRALILHRFLQALTEYRSILCALHPETIPSEQVALAVIASEFKRTRERLSPPNAFNEAVEAYETWLREGWKPFADEL